MSDEPGPGPAGGAEPPAGGPRWLTRNVRVLSAVSLAQDAASELLYPVLPLFITGVLGAPPVAVGVIEGVAEGSAAAAKYVSGRVSDRSGRKPLVRLGYGLAALGKVIVAMAWIWPVVLAGRVVDRLGKGIRGAPRDALLAEDVEQGDLGKVYGFHRTADTLGAVIGPLAGLAILAATQDNLRAALWIAVIPAVLSVLLVGLAREKAPTAPAVKPAEDGTPVERVRVPLPQRVRRVSLLLALIAVVNFPDALVLLRVSEVGFSAMGVVGVYLLYNLVYSAVSYPAGALSDRLPRARVYALGAGLLRGRLPRARPRRRRLGGRGADARLRGLQRAHRRGGQGVDHVPHPACPAWPRAGAVPGAQRRRGPARGPVGRARLGARPGLRRGAARGLRIGRRGGGGGPVGGGPPARLRRASGGHWRASAEPVARAYWYAGSFIGPIDSDRTGCSNRGIAVPG